MEKVRTIEDLLADSNRYMESAHICEEKGDFIAAEGFYHICRNIYESLESEMGAHKIEIQTGYMRTLFDSAMLPQIDANIKENFLTKAQQLSTILQQETGDIEFMIAAEGIQFELEELTKDFEKDIMLEFV